MMERDTCKWKCRVDDDAEAGTDTSDTVFVELGAIRETVETAAWVTNVLDTRINTGYNR